MNAVPAHEHIISDIPGTVVDMKRNEIRRKEQFNGTRNITFPIDKVKINRIYIEYALRETETQCVFTVRRTVRRNLSRQMLVICTDVRLFFFFFWTLVSIEGK